MTSASKAKGNSFERRVADFLTNLYGEKFIRAPGSGAYVGGKNAARKQLLHEGQIRNFKGDIVPGQSFPKFNAECKSYKDFAFHQLFNSNRVLEDWINQLMAVSDSGDFNILCMKFNRKGEYVVTQASAVTPKGAYMVYHHDSQGVWYIQDWQQFWNNHAQQVAQLSA